MRKILLTTAALVMGATGLATAQEADLDSLLRRVQEGRVTETAEHQRREAEFRQRQDQQRQLLNEERATIQRLERESERLEKQRRDNEAEISRLLEVRRDRAGQLSELFGVLQQAAGDARSTINTSHVSVDFPLEDRIAGIDTLVDKASDSAELPTLQEIRAWPAQMMLEMIESAKSVTFEHEVRKIDGTTELVDLTRVGDFALVGNGRYYQLKDGALVEELPRQPSSRFTGTIGGYQEASGALGTLGIDPTRGQILSLEVERPTLAERVNQGGEVGYLIIALGIVGVIMAVIQWLYLTMVAGKVRSQIKNTSSPSANNPLGRVLSVYEQNKSVDVETLELKLDEAILKETPALERFLTLIKLISAVAPLFGLLGTVVGMIATFQAITLFGTGDPTMMAAGISQALVTTVLGLVVAIPTLLLHSFVAGTSKSVIHVLEEQSAGIIAAQAEKEHAGARA